MPCEGVRIEVTQNVTYCQYTTADRYLYINQKFWFFISYSHL